MVYSENMFFTLGGENQLPFQVDIKETLRETVLCGYRGANKCGVMNQWSSEDVIGVSGGQGQTKEAKCTWGVGQGCLTVFWPLSEFTGDLTLGTFFTVKDWIDTEMHKQNVSGPFPSFPSCLPRWNACQELAVHLAWSFLCIHSTV